ncbi:glycoside hydrolase family 44 protein [Clostridium hydrogenum]|uniref:glycoside hydrolase family 44 protein n=1 Tax=Clostridium hydrogenum TaxID=2855764 RepID=UPI001F2D6D42|nr:glycoside hydrolase family 44 protein [Clostridium hydrogenum]
MKVKKLACLVVITFISSITLGSVSGGHKAHAGVIGDININVDTQAEKNAISPYIYGTNQDFANAKVNSRRIGGNRLSCYNWENNFSNAGNDYMYSSDDYLMSLYNVPGEKRNEPASVITTFHDKSLAEGVPYSLVTLQAAGYVSADGNGAVAKNETAPSNRWKEVKFHKGGPLSLTPDLNDNYVYMDEFVNFLVNKYGKASSLTGIKGYSLDNEPSLWSSTHSEVHPNKTTCAEILNKDVELSKTVKGIDPTAEVFGPALYGFSAFNSFNDAPDWSSVKGNYSWFIDYYLDNMKKQSDAAGKRLLDVLDLHWYPEATGGGSRIVGGTFDPNNIECNKARLQAPRTLWDPTYTENSWIAQWDKWALPLIPTVKASINRYNPGTKLSFSEYDYGGENHITGGIAEADVLGIFGKYGVYNSNFWQCQDDDSYIQSAFNLYNNYDGNNSTYGDTNVKCNTSDVTNSSAYASVVSKDGSKLHLIVLNKNYDSPVNFNFNISSDKQYKSGKVWGFDKNSTAVIQKQGITNIANNKFTYKIPPLTALHIVLDTNNNNIMYGNLNVDNTMDMLDFEALRNKLL